MTINRYFNVYNNQPEQDLLSDLYQEQIQCLGMEVVYLPRQTVKLDSILGEDAQSQFTSGFTIEIFPENVYQFDKNMDFMSIEGLEIRDSAKIVFSRKSFMELLFGSGRERPLEGDLIYFPLSKHKSLFEISYSQDEEPFYQWGDLYVYKATIQMFEYSGEKLRTGIPEIDAIEDRYVASIDVVVSSGSGNYTPKEVVYQGPDLTHATYQAEVISWDSGTNTLKLKHSAGPIQNTEALVGNTSLTSRVVSSTSLDDGRASTNDPLQDNKAFSDEGSDILSWNPKNPFGSK